MSLRLCLCDQDLSHMSMHGQQYGRIQVVSQAMQAAWSLGDISAAVAQAGKHGRRLPDCAEHGLSSYGFLLGEETVNLNAPMRLLAKAYTRLAQVPKVSSWWVLPSHVDASPLVPVLYILRSTPLHHCTSSCHEHCVIAEWSR